MHVRIFGFEPRAPRADDRPALRDRLAALDPVTDKLFVLTVVITLVGSHRLSVGAILLLTSASAPPSPTALLFLASFPVRLNQSPDSLRAVRVVL
jgi:hypothetical protein